MNNQVEINTYHTLQFQNFEKKIHRKNPFFNEKLGSNGSFLDFFHANGVIVVLILIEFFKLFSYVGVVIFSKLFFVVLRCTN